MTWGVLKEWCDRFYGCRVRCSDWVVGRSLVTIGPLKFKGKWSVVRGWPRGPEYEGSRWRPDTMSPRGSSSMSRGEASSPSRRRSLSVTNTGVARLFLSCLSFEFNILTDWLDPAEMITSASSGEGKIKRNITGSLLTLCSSPPATSSTYWVKRKIMSEIWDQDIIPLKTWDYRHIALQSSYHYFRSILELREDWVW